MINKEDLQKLADLYQDIIWGIQTDLETGSHRFNNVENLKFKTTYPELNKALNALGKWITRQEDLHESID